MLDETELSAVRELARYVTQLSGIELDDSKSYLFETRCRKLMADLGCDSFTCLRRQVLGDRSGKARAALVDALSTNETSFFREPAHFSLLAHKLVPDHFEHFEPKRLRIWSAAAATGQEAFSVAIVLKELLGSFAPYRIQLVGTDISQSALTHASRGVYSTLEVSRGLSPVRRDRHFVRSGDGWQIADELRGLVVFRQLNLLESLAGVGVFDVIFCRNVTIYFSESTREELFRRIARQLRPRGALLLSATEALTKSAPFVRREFHGTTYYEVVS